MRDRAPDGQPTENIAQCLKSEVERLEYWKQCRIIEARALARSENMVAQGVENVERWQNYLAIRLAEEAAAGVEVTGL